MTPNELKLLRNGVNLSQEGLARRLNCAVNTVARWERGVNPINELTAIAIRATIKKEK